ncbi:MAG: hypothetical protein ACQEP7_06100 [bacterium]
MKFTKIFSVVILILVAGGQPAAANFKITSPPLLSSSFSEGDVDGRHEFIYINYDNVKGYGFERTRREAHSDQLAVTGNYGLYYLDGEQTYEQDGSPVEHEIDYYFFIPAGVNLEYQRRLASSVNFILFGGPRLHFGRSKDSSTHEGETSSGLQTDYGLGGEVGALLGISTGNLYITPFVSFDKIRVESTSSAADVDDQSFDFENRTVGLDILHRGYGVTLSALVGTPEDEEAEEMDDFTIFKLGWTF